VASPPPPPQLFPDEDMARREGGYFCPASMPRVGERVDIDSPTGRTRTATVITSSPALQGGLYEYDQGNDKLQVTPGFENADCTVLVRYDDDGTTATVSAAEKAQPLWIKYSESIVDLLVVGTYAGVSFAGDVHYDSRIGHYDRVKEEYVELLAELAATSRELEEDARRPSDERDIQVPVSGEYWGSSEESDEGDQAVRTTIKFGADGKISGRGKDGVDGAYRITSGRWGVNISKKKPTVAWMERYDAGFTVVVSGEYDPATGKIKGSFTSSRNVKGNFEIAPKPSGF